MKYTMREKKKRLDTIYRALLKEREAGNTVDMKILLHNIKEEYGVCERKAMEYVNQVLLRIKLKYGDYECEETLLKFM